MRVGLDDVEGMACAAEDEERGAEEGGEGETCGVLGGGGVGLSGCGGGAGNGE